MKQLVEELHNKKLSTFTQESKQNNILYLRKADIEMQVGVIEMVDSARGTGKVLDRSGQKKIKR